SIPKPSRFYLSAELILCPRVHILLQSLFLAKDSVGDTLCYLRLHNEQDDLYNPTMNPIYSFPIFFMSILVSFCTFCQCVTNYKTSGKWQLYFNLGCDRSACCRAVSTVTPSRNNLSYNKHIN
ncbi:unnamed protein product, partial [Urochloa humidicola]